MSKSNMERAIRFETPDYVPMYFHINSACWEHYPLDFMFEQMESHPLLFPGYKRPTGEFKPRHSINAIKDKPYTDDWGCVWETSMDGIVGTVVKHPLETYDNFDSYKAPDPSKCMGVGPLDWDAEERAIKKAKAEGRFVSRSLTHGHTFLRLCDIRGYENVIFDMADEDENFMKLLKMNEEFNLYIVERYLKLGVDMFMYPEDLGMQTGPLISPEYFKRFIAPSYKRIIDPAREKNVLVHMHSDGNIRELLDDIIGSGVDAINLQDTVNGIDWIKTNLKGRLCIDLDIDRQHITLNGTPKDIDEHIGNAVKELGSKQGGLTMVYGLYPGIPLENAKAVMDAMEKYASYWS